MNTPLCVASPIAWKKSAVCSTVTSVATMPSMRCRSRRVRLRARGRGDRRFERGQRFPHVVIAHVVQREGARHARGHVDTRRARDHHELRAALALEHAVGLELAQRFAHGAAVHAELPRQLHLGRQPIARVDGRVGDALEQRRGDLAVGGLDADGCELSRCGGTVGGVGSFGAGAWAHAVAS